jgi:hypothetical protein
MPLRIEWTELDENRLQGSRLCEYSKESLGSTKFGYLLTSSIITSFFKKILYEFPIVTLFQS